MCAGETCRCAAVWREAMYTYKYGVSAVSTVPCGTPNRSYMPPMFLVPFNEKRPLSASVFHSAWVTVFTLYSAASNWTTRNTFLVLISATTASKCAFENDG